MSSNENKLLPFYFGSLADEQRLEIERELLIDEELLLDYLDLKRKIEGAVSVPAQPSALLWQKLKPKTTQQKIWWLSVAIGAAVAASLFFFLQMHSPSSDDQHAKFLFDSGAEQSSAANVL